MSTKARWGSASAVTAAPVDPFADLHEGARRTPADVGLHATFSNSSRSYLDGLTSTIAEVEALAARGVTCEIREKPATSCHACPLSALHRDGDPMQPLCQAGLAFERLSTEMTVAEKVERDARNS